VLSAVGAALALGLLGSFHCALMCGPLLAAGCAREGRRGRALLGYLGGRLASYAFAGAIFGALGARAAHRFSASSIQTVALLAFAALALLKGFKLLFADRARPPLVAIRRSAPSPGLRLLASLVPRRALPLGLLTGALPCGLLAGAWILAASTGDPLGGAMLMLAFSIATAPGLLASLLLALPALRRRWSPSWQGALWCALALFVGLRPLLDHAVHARCCGGH